MPRRRSVLLFVALLLVFVVLSQTRFVDADEGYLLFASRLVRGGSVPYRDFFFPQPPLFPVVHAPFVRLGWTVARAFDAVLAATTGMVVVLAVRQRRLGPRSEVLAAALFASTALAFAWLPIAKTYALATLGLAVARLAAWGGTSRSETGRALVVGSSLALAASSRLYLLAIVPVVVFGFLRGATRRVRSAGFVALGFVAVGALWLPWLASAPDVAWFDLVDFHRRLFPLRGGPAFAQKLETLASLVGGRTADRFLGLQLVGLLAVALLGGRPRDFTALLLVTLALLTFVPAPTYVQYFCVATPFLVELAVVGLATRRWDRGPALGALLVAHLVAGALELRRHTVTGAELIGVGADQADRWRLSSVRAAARDLRRFGACGPVVAAWPGHLVEGELTAWPGTESHFGIYAAALLADPSARRRARVLTREEIADAFAAPAGPRLFVDARLWPGALDATVLADRLPRAAEGAGVVVFSRCVPASPG